MKIANLPFSEDLGVRELQIRGGAPREESGKYMGESTEKWHYDSNGNPHSGLNLALLWEHTDASGSQAKNTAEMGVLGGTYGFSSGSN